MPAVALGASAGGRDRLILLPEDDLHSFLELSKLQSLVGIGLKQSCDNRAISRCALVLDGSVFPRDIARRILNPAAFIDVNVDRVLFSSVPLTDSDRKHIRLILVIIEEIAPPDHLKIENIESAADA